MPPPSPAPERAGTLDRVIAGQNALVPILAILLALVIGGVLIRLQGVDPFYAYQVMFKSALFSTDGLLRTLQKATPLVFSGLAVALALRVGLFNIGAEGQLAWGAIGAAIVGVSFASLPAILLVPLCAITGVVLGGVWGAIAGLLKATRGVHEVISTIMLNSIAAGIIGYLVTEPLKEPGQNNPQTADIAEHAFMANLGPIPIGFVVAIGFAAFLTWVLSRTTVGFQFQLVGANQDAARYAGTSITRIVVSAMAASGALAGLGGAIETMGVVHRYTADSNAGLGFDGITIALLARTNPVATIPAALLVGVLRAGAETLQFDTGIQPEVVDVLLAVSLLLVSLPLLGRLLFRRRGGALAPLAGTGGAV